MAEFPLVHRSAVSAELSSGKGAVLLRALPEGLAVQVLGRPDGDDLVGLLNDIATHSYLSVRSAGPGQWWIIGDTPMAHSALQALSARLAPQAFCVDQSHGRVRIGIEGPAAARALAKGTGVDLDSLALGQSAMTLVGHISVHMTRTAPDSFELLVLRGFSESLWDDLVRMSAEFR